MKKIILSVLAVIMLASVGIVTDTLLVTDNVAYAAEAETIAEVTESGACGAAATWELDSKGTLHIKGEGAISQYSYGTAPWYAHKDSIYSVIVDDSVTTISAGAFYGCNSLQEITLPFVGANETSAGYSGNFGYIFGYLKSSSWSQKILSNGASLHFMAHYGGGESDNFYEAPRNTASYDIYYYYVPSSITKVNITSAKKLAAGAFYDYNHITEINLNNEITVINDYAFKNCGVVPSSEEDLVVSGDILIAYKGSGTNVVLPEGIELIAPRAFENNSTLSSVQLSDTVTWVGDYAFYNCTNAIIAVPKISGSLTLGTNAFTATGSVQYLDKSSYTNGNDTFYYMVDKDNNAVIVGCETTSVNITLPVMLGGYNVVAVGYRGMADCTTLVSATIPSNITKLDLYAFAGCIGIDTVTIPATCVYVGEYAFSGCSALTTVVIAEGVTYLGDNCFENCTSLTEIVVPDSCTYLGEYAFYNCVSLESATIGITVPEIGNYAFYNCEKLRTVVIGIAVENIGDYAFYNTALTRVTTPNTLKNIGDFAFSSCENLERVTLRSGFLKIGNGSFKNDALLATINFPSTIESIGEYAFYGCAALENVSIPAPVTEIKDYTFAYCTALSSATLNGTIESIGEYAFYRAALSDFDFTEGLSYIGAGAFEFNQLTEIILPDSLLHIGEQAFNANKTRTVSMPDSVSYVGAYTFSDNADGLTVSVRYNTGKIADYMLYNTDIYTVIMEEGITEIGNYTFALNRKLANITFPSTLQIIGDYAFYDNRAYSSIELPSNVVTVGTYAFARGYLLNDIRLPDSVHSIGECAFYRDEDKEIFPSVTITFYYNNGVICDNILNSQHIHHIVVEDNIYSVGNNVFSNCSNLETVSLPDTISSFGTNCFINDNGITLYIRVVDGYIDDEIYKEKLTGVDDLIVEGTAIGNSAFYGNVLLKTAVVNGVSNIGNYAFYNCNAMTDFTINGTVETIGSHAFDSCKAMGGLVLPETVNYIGDYAFYDCNSMDSINIPNGIEKILSHTFFGCASLNQIVLPDSITAVEDYAFYGCIKAQSIILSNQCVSIGGNAFYNCKAITELIIPDSVKTIGEYAFRSCVEVKELIFSDNIEEIGACAFYDCNALKIVRLGKRVTELKDRMFYGCVNLTDLYVNAPLSFIDELAFYGAEDVTIHCGRDDYMIAFFEENGLNYEIDESLIYEYKVVFKDADGNILSSALYNYGETVTIPVPPQKDSDNTYTYVFKDWGKDVTTVGGNAEYNATYTSIFIEYIVVFKNYDGTLLSSNSYHYGDTIAEPNTPIKPADNTFIYNFIGWDKPIVACNGNIEYTAVFTPEYINYYVIFKDDNGDTLLSKQYHYGDTIELPANPTKSPDNTFTYVFKSWDKDVESTCIGNVEYIAVYASTYIDYIVKFLNYDGSVLSEKQYHYGDTIVAPKTPQKQADNTYTYNFSGWDNSATVCNGNMTFVALFTPEYIEYKIVFKNYDNAILSESYYHYGDSIVKPTIPTKPSDKIYDYVFDGWNKAVSICKSDETFIAQFVSRYIEYEVIFKNYDGIIISRNTYHYGESIIVPDAPTRQSDQIGSYKFAGWDKDIEVCNGDIDYNATYEITYIKYIVVFKDDNGSELLRAMYHYGDAVVIPTTPVKSADNTYTYSFTAWDNEVSNTCVGNAEYTAMYTATFIEYTVKFLNYDGSIITEENYHYGDTISEPPTPAKAADLTYRYVFNGWNKAVSSCVGDVEYTATFKEEFIIYTIVFTNDDGTILSETEYHYNDTIVVPSTPQKVADQTYTYTFKSWDKDVANNVSCDMVYCAVFDKAFIEYSIRFLDYDGTVLKESNYHYGDTVLSPNDPTRDEYLFKCWSPTLSAVAGDVDYTAMYSKIYTISIDGGAINSSNVAAAIDGEIVTVKANKTVQNKVFKGWSIDGGKTIISQEEEYSFAVTSDLSLVAVYEDEISELSTGAIIGITISAIIVFEIVCFCIIWFGIKKKKLSDLFRKNK